jgi:hypothetical protein
MKWIFSIEIFTRKTHSKHEMYIFNNFYIENNNEKLIDLRFLIYISVVSKIFSVKKQEILVAEEVVQINSLLGKVKEIYREIF